MSNTQKAAYQQEQLELALAIMKTNHPWSYTVHSMQWLKDDSSISAYQALAAGRLLKLDFVQPSDGTLRNPHNLTANQVGAGYRLVTKYEAENNIYQEHAEIWFGSVKPTGWRKFSTLNMRENWGASIRVPVSCPFVIEMAWVMPSPPPGMQWHRADWVKEDLPPGYRPLLLKEERQSDDELIGFSFNGYKWAEYGILKQGDFSLDMIACKGSNKTRTKRPLPNLPSPQAPSNIEYQNHDGLSSAGFGYRFATKFEAANNIHQNQAEFLNYDKEWKRFQYSTMSQNFGCSIRVPCSCIVYTEPVKPSSTPPIKPWVRLEAKDIKPGSRIRDPDWDDEEYEIIQSVFTDKIYTSSGYHTYKSLMEDKWLIQHPGGNWQPCHKQS